MDTIVHATAITGLILTAANVILYPAFIGKPKPPDSFGGWFGVLIGAAMMVILCGRVLGWW